MMFGKRKRAQALIAQSLYQPLNDAEEVELDTLLDRFTDLKEEAAELRALKDRVPRTDPLFEGDLRPVVMAAIAKPRGVRFPILPHWAVALAAFLFVATGVAYWIVMHPPAAVAPGSVAEAPAASPVGTALAEAQSLVDSRSFADAYALLARNIDAHPDDPRAAEACQQMADIAFAELQWYPEAFAAYDDLRHRYAGQFRANPENFVRLNLLDEQRGLDSQYAGLRALDNARRDGSFDALEDLAARNPATYLASAAAVQMAQLAAEEQGFDPHALPVRAMRAAQLRSSNAVTRSQLKFEVAQLLAASPDERERARDLLEELANGSITTLVEAARKSLAEFETKDAANPKL